jgi:DNA-directed RNA polymerase subunit RPC12/RpoP
MSEAVLKDMRKPADVKITEQALAWTVQAGITVHGHFIFGAEAETDETFLETISWWLNNRKYSIVLSLVTPYPGSHYYDNCVKRGIIKDKREYIEQGCPWVNMSKMTDYEFNRLATLIALPPDVKITWDFACHGEIIETIPNYKGRAGIVSMELKCFHCGAVNTYGNLPVEDVSHYFYMHCRNCGLLSTYGIPPSFNDALAEQLVKNEAQGNRLADWIKENGFERVTVYGASVLNELLYQYLESFNLAAGGINISAENIRRANADLVLLTSPQMKNHLAADLRENGCDCHIETLFDVVFGITQWRGEGIKVNG